MSKFEYGDTPVDFTIPMTNANQEYALVIPEEAVAIEIQCRDATDVRFSFTAGLVAGATEPFRTLKSGSVYQKNHVYLNATTLYVACGSSGKTVEVRVWQ